MAITYDQLANFLADESPYSMASDVIIEAGFTDLTQTVTQVATPTTIPFDGRWQWRHARPWKNEPTRPGRPDRPRKVRTYKIAKALLVPYTYTRKLPSTFGGSTLSSAAGSLSVGFGGPSEVRITIQAHLLIGYTGEQTSATSGSAAGAGQGYPELAQLIRDATPGANPAASPLPSLTATSTNISTLSGPSEDRRLEIAETWLTNVSAKKAALGQCELESNSDLEMDLIQEQQCLYWGFPVADSGGALWLRYFQVTKAVRAEYQITVKGTTSTEQVLIGVTGAGDM